jgi:hypothetical protein
MASRRSIKEWLGLALALGLFSAIVAGLLIGLAKGLIVGAVVFLIAGGVEAVQILGSGSAES